MVQASPDSREFQGRDLDECITSAISWYDCGREMLEIEIVQDGRQGIFGFLGSRKAIIRARRADMRDALRLLQAQNQQRSDQRLAGESAVERELTPGAIKERSQNRKPVCEKEDAGSGANDFDIDSEPIQESWGDAPLASQNKEEVKKLCKEIVTALLRPLADREFAIEVDLNHAYPHVQVDWQGDAGLLIGRDGQTLIATQYLASRMLSHKLGAAMRVRIDIGNYRARQDDKICELARELAEKAIATGRQFSTRPLSSYHRRLVHLCLQKEEAVQTRSVGEGSFKRVLVSPRRS